MKSKKVVELLHRDHTWLFPDGTPLELPQIKQPPERVVQFWTQWPAHPNL